MSAVDCGDAANYISDVTLTLMVQHQSFFDGDGATMTCAEGYTSVIPEQDTFQLTCQSDGTWALEELAPCQRKSRVKWTMSRGLYRTRCRGTDAH